MRSERSTTGPGRFARIALVAALTLPALRPARAEAASDTSVREGQEHVHRGLELYEEGDLDGAHAELERAYELAPAYKILYNLAQISLRRQDWVTAERELRAYLAEGKGRLPPGRAREVEDTLARVATRTATIDVAVAAPGARLVVDQASAVPLPLPRPLVVNVGRHVMTAIWPSGDRDAKSFEVAGGDHLALKFDAPADHEEPRREAPAVPTRTLVAAQLEAPHPAARVDSEDEDATVLERRAAPRPEASRAHSSRGPWIGWTATALVAAGAGAAGIMAVRSSRQLAADRGSYPIDQATLDDESLRTRRYSWGADALAVTAVALAGVSLYLSFRHSAGE
jgi:hypothetical protein